MKEIFSLIKDFAKPLAVLLAAILGYKTNKVLTENKNLKEEAKNVRETLKFKKDLSYVSTAAKRKFLRDKFPKKSGN